MTNKPSTLFARAIMNAPQIIFAAISLVFVGCSQPSTIYGNEVTRWEFAPGYQQVTLNPVSFWRGHESLPSKQEAFTEFDATCLQKWQGDNKVYFYPRMYPFVLYVEKREGRHFSGKICYLHNLGRWPQKEWSVVRVEGEVYDEVSSHPDASKWALVKQIHALSDIRSWWVFNEVEKISGPTFYLHAWNYVCIDGKGKLWGGYFDSKALTAPSCIFSATRKK